MIKLTFHPPTGDPAWDAWVEECRATVEQVERGERTGIDDELYKRQRDRFLAASHGKCAYCELELAPGQRTGDVEHYRPKARVRDADGRIVKVERDGVTVRHPGYYWLAYDWLNLLPACSACNRRAKDRASGMQTGKADIFPTLDRVWAASPDEIAAEQPALLNPWVDDPREHLAFDPETGIVEGRTDRGRITVRILGLNRDRLPEARKTAALEVRRTMSNSASDAAKDRLDDADLEDLLAVKRGSATYAAVRRAALKAAVERLLEHVHVVAPDD